MASSGIGIFPIKLLEIIKAIEDKKTPNIINSIVSVFNDSCESSWPPLNPIENKRYNEIKSRYPSSKEESALVEIIDSLYTLIPIFSSLQHILDNMTTHNDDGSIAVYSINTTVLSRFIKQSYTDFLEPIVENSDVTDLDDMVSVEEVD